jgi:hypothetical protein
MSEFNSNKANLSIPQKMVRWLFREDKLSLGLSEWIQLLSATLIKSNLQFSKDFFDALSQKIALSFADPELSDTKKDIIIYNALSYIAFTSPQDGQRLTIKGIQYAIQKIALTSGWLSAPYYAYGLKAVTDKEAQSFLIFQGTTTPADHGFLAGLLADTMPGGAVGAQLYARGQKKIQDWINREYQRTGKRVLCTGQSLGGAMSLHAHVHQPERVDFFVVNPPTLTGRERKICESNSSALVAEDSRILKVVSHINDPVWGLGSLYLPTGTQVFRHGEENEGRFIAHAQSADCCVNATEPLFVVHDQEKVTRSIIWKIIKPCLFLIALILHVIAWPMRVMIQIANVYFYEKNSAPEGADSPEESKPCEKYHGSNAALILARIPSGTTHNPLVFSSDRPSDKYIMDTHPLLARNQEQEIPAHKVRPWLASFPEPQPSSADSKVSYVP